LWCYAAGLPPAAYCGTSFLCAALAKPMQQNTSCTTNGHHHLWCMLLRSKTKEGIFVWVVDSGTPPDMPPFVPLQTEGLQNKIKVDIVDSSCGTPQHGSI